jgi:4-hydroxy-3-polyprenylbenzoate decarboxylase
MTKRKIVIGITGASGSIYAQRILDFFENNKIKNLQIDIVMSDVAKSVWQQELRNKKFEDYSFRLYKNSNFYAPFASGSAKYDTLIIIPCSMGTMGRIANGISNDLISRAADVMLKERKKLIIVPRESPINLIHIKNMETLMLAGADIIPAMPSFYSRPNSIEEAVDTVVHRVLQHADIEVDSYRWGGE